jgi:broad specificity phosphatase PhoE
VIADGSGDPEMGASRPTGGRRSVVRLLRHGEVHNPDGILYGRLAGYHLSELGRKMADRIADFLKEQQHDIAAVVSSPLERAQETAEPIAAAFGLDVRTDVRLIEPSNVFEGLTFGVGDGSLRRPGHWRYLLNPFRPSWGEPYAHQAGRMLAAMADARELAPGREIVCVSHQLPIWVTRRRVEGKPLWHDPRRRECTLASLTSFTYEGAAIETVSYVEPVKDLLPVKVSRTFDSGA